MDIFGIYQQHIKQKGFAEDSYQMCMLQSLQRIMDALAEPATKGWRSWFAGKQAAVVLAIGGDRDYRQAFLAHAQVYHSPLGAAAEAKLQEEFMSLVHYFLNWKILIRRACV